MDGFDCIKTAITKDSVFIIGKVLSVDGRTVKVKVFKNKNSSHLFYDGEMVKNVSVGSYVRIKKGFVNIIGKVEGEEVREERVFNADYGKNEMRISRILQVSLYGHFEDDRFSQGIKEMPLLDNECFLLDKDGFEQLHNFHKANEPTVRIGTLTEEPMQEIRLSSNKLFASHIGIFGNTGSGKSNTLARIYSNLFTQNVDNIQFKSRSTFVVVDFNGEYTEDDVICSKKSVFKLSTRVPDQRYPILRDEIEKADTLSVLLEATEKTQRPFLSRAMKNSFLDEDFANRSKENIGKICKSFLQKSDPIHRVSIFEEIFTSLKSISTEEGKSSIDEFLHWLSSGNLKWHGQKEAYYFEENDQTTYSNSESELLFEKCFKSTIENLQLNEDLLSRLRFKILSQYFHEILNNYSNQEHIRPLIGRMAKKFTTLSKVINIVPTTDELPENNLQIISLRGVNIEMKKVLPLIIAKQLYEKRRNEDDRTKTLHLIIDEAHNILSRTSERESETWKDYRLETFEEIIKEGRKFGAFLTIASQRPQDISPTIISQLHNYFIHRLLNNHDISAIEKSVAYLDKLSFQTIPILSVGSCFVAGIASDIPIKVSIDPLPTKRQPRSQTVSLSEIWSE